MCQKALAGQLGLEQVWVKGVPGHAATEPTQWDSLSWSRCVPGGPAALCSKATLVGWLELEQAQDECVPGCSAPRPPQDDWGWSRHRLGWPWVVGMWLELV